MHLGFMHIVLNIFPILGVNVVTRAVATEASTLKERTIVMAHMSIAQGAGFSFGPGERIALLL